MRKHDKNEWHFLIVDDLDHQRIALKAAIQEVVPRSEFVEAESLAQAKKIVESKADTIDLAVIDLKLTDHKNEGVELIKMIKRNCHRSQVRTILITAFPCPANSDLAKAAGADGFISKLDTPVTQELQEMVLKLLGLRRLPGKAAKKK